MGGDEPEPDSAGLPQRSYLDRVSLKRLHQTIIATALATTAAFGGLDQHVPMTPVALGSTYDNGPLKITPDKVAMICTPPEPESKWPDTVGGAPLEYTPEYIKKRGQFFALYATVENTTDLPVILSRRLNMGQHPADRSMTLTFSLVRSGDFGSEGTFGSSGSVRSLQPGKVDQVRVVWFVPAGELKIGDPITIRINDLELGQPLAQPTRDWGLSKTESYGEIDTQVLGCGT